MVAEWFAYLADILTFYNERIANQDYLRTADLPESVNHLIRLLGYRPRPAIGATGTLAALVTPGQSAVLPKGLQIQSKPGPGQAPQIFELSADTAIALPDQVAAAPPPHLLASTGSPPLRFLSGSHARRGLLSPWRIEPIGLIWPSPNYSLLLGGAIKTIDPGATLVLRPRDAALGDPMLAKVSSATIEPADGGGQQTALGVSLTGAPPDPFTAAQASLERANQTIGVWNFFSTGVISGSTVHLASLARQIRPGQWVAMTASGASATLFKVTAVADAVWDANSDAPRAPSGDNAIPMPHTVLTLDGTPSASFTTVLFDWISVGPLIDQPYATWTGAPTALVAASRTPFPATSGASVIVRDAAGLGFVTKASSGGDNHVQLGALPDPPPALTPPFQLLYNPLPVTRGKTVRKEILGSGDATKAGQDFALAQSPVTYLEQGASFASTIALTVDGEPWKEVAFFYGQPADAQVFVTREDDKGQTHVMFGDGVNGARLTTGVNNVVASYRIGAGAASPPAGKLTMIAQSYPGLRAILNPVAVGGGADPDPPNQIRRYAPRSVLTFGRAVSVFDYEALAAQAPGATRARAVWAWNDARQRTLVTVHVGDDAAAVTSASQVLAATGDPNRPVSVVQATAVPAGLTLTLIVTPGMDTDAIGAAAAAALTDPDTGVFSANALPVGQPVFDSQIEEGVLAVAGAVAIAAQRFTMNGALDAGPLHDPGEGGYFVLAAADVTIVTEPDPNG
jgi:predicted phage baseplate assembly protein